MVREHADRRERRVSLTLRREILARGAPGTLLRTQLPLEIDAEGQSDANVEVRAGTGVQAVRAGDRIDARMPAGSAPMFEVGYAIDLRCAWRGEVVEAQRVESVREAEPSLGRWLSDAEGTIQVTSGIRSLARDLAEGTSTSWEAIRKLWSYVFRTITFGYVPYDRLEGREVLSKIIELGRADCWHASALLVGLCRALGLPARIVGGLPLHPSFSALHYWCEIHVLPYGWLPFDLTVSWVCAAGDPESSTWRDTFFGQLEPRLVLETFPRRRILLGPRLPKTFFHQIRSKDGGTEATFHDRDGGQPTYRDRVELTSVRDPREAARSKTTS
jgi:transglutaminase-like putative cysteine protease